jgi:hypothetical protein
LRLVKSADEKVGMVGYPAQWTPGATLDAHRRGKLSEVANPVGGLPSWSSRSLSGGIRRETVSEPAAAVVIGEPGS